MTDFKLLATKTCSALSKYSCCICILDPITITCQLLPTKIHIVYESTYCIKPHGFQLHNGHGCGLY